MAASAMIWPAASPAEHITTAATVDARLKERRSAGSWTIEIRWTADCRGARPGTAWFDGRLTLVDLDTNERIDAGGVVSTSGAAAIAGTRDWSVTPQERSLRLMPELTIYCYENFPLHGGQPVTVTGSAVVVPRRFGGGSGTGGGGSGDSGSGGDPTAPLSSGGCGPVVMGTDGPDRLTGADVGEIVFGFAGNDLIRGRAGHDCLLGDDGNDTLRGERGDDRLTGGAGADVLVGGPGTNAYDAGPGRDVVDARNGRRELVRCGSGRDRARVDRRDRVRGCERVTRR
jgi:Ca2+-binding RTX toxin-like protein